MLKGLLAAVSGRLEFSLPISAAGVFVRTHPILLLNQLKVLSAWISSRWTKLSLGTTVTLRVAYVRTEVISFIYTFFALIRSHRLILRPT